MAIDISPNQTQNQDSKTESNFLHNNINRTDHMPQSLWSDSLAIIKGRVNSQSYKTWFEPMVPLAIEVGVDSVVSYELVVEALFSDVANLILVRLVCCH